MQNAMQTTIRLHSHVEGALKAAAESQQPITVRDMFQKADVHAAAKSEQQVRDLLKTFTGNKLALQLPIVDASGDKRSRVGFMWNTALSEQDAMAVRERMSRTSRLTNSAVKANTKIAKTPRLTAPVPAPQVKQELPVRPVEVAKPQQDLELVFGAVSISIGKNEKTGAVRITFQL